jgi:hypothetical protein
VRRLDHVFLEIGSKPVLRSEDRPDHHPGGLGAIDDVAEGAVNRRRVAHEADLPALEQPAIEEHVGSETHVQGRV